MGNRKHLSSLERRQIAAFRFVARVAIAVLTAGILSAAPLAASADVITVLPASLPAGAVGQSYNQQLTALGGTAPYSFSLASGSLPGGLTLSPDGSLSGTPAMSGTFFLGVTATDSLGNIGTATYILTIAPPTGQPPGTVRFSLDATGLPDTVAPHGTFDGQTVNLPFTTFVPQGSTHTFSYPQLVSGGPGTRFKTNDQGGSVVANADFAATSAYRTQYLLTTATDPASLADLADLTSGGWFDAGTVVNLNAKSQILLQGVGLYDLSGWSKNVTFPSVVPKQAVVEMSRPQLVVATYSPELAVLINSDARSGEICRGATATLAAVTTTPTVSFSWTASDGSISSSDSFISVEPTTTTTYTVTVRDGTGATAKASFTIVVNPLPTLTISGAPPNAIPLGTTVNLAGGASGGTGPYNFSWSNGSSAATITDTPPIGQTTYTATATDANGCSGSARTTVHVFDYHIRLTLADQTVLAGTAATYDAMVDLVPGSDLDGGAGGPVIVRIQSALTVTPQMFSSTLSSVGFDTPVTVQTSTTTLGDFTLTATASIAGGSRAGTAKLHIYDYELDVGPPSQTVPIGGGPASYTITAPLVPGSTSVGLPSGVNVVVTGLPTSITPTLPPSIGLGSSVPLSLGIGSTDVGDYPFNIVSAVPGGGRTSDTTHLMIAYNIGVLYDQDQVHKAGSTMPIKIQLEDASGKNLSSADIAVHALYFVNSVGGIVPVQNAGNSNPNNDFRFDPTLGTTGGYIYNAPLPVLGAIDVAPVSGLVFIAGADGTRHLVGFILK